MLSLACFQEDLFSKNCCCHRVVCFCSFVSKMICFRRVVVVMELVFCACLFQRIVVVIGIVFPFVCLFPREFGSDNCCCSKRLFALLVCFQENLFPENCRCRRGCLLGLFVSVCCGCLFPESLLSEDILLSQLLLASYLSTECLSSENVVSTEVV